MRILPLPLPMVFSQDGCAGRGQGKLLFLGRDKSLEAGGSSVGQRHDDLERKRGYYHFIFSLEGLRKYLFSVCLPAKILKALLPSSILAT